VWIICTITPRSDAMKKIVGSRLPEQKQKAAKRAAENGYGKGACGPCGSAFDYRAMRLGHCSDHV